MLTSPKWLSVVFLSLALSAIAFADDPFAAGVRETPWLKPEEEQQKFKLPPGFVIELVAAEPQIQKPLNMAFDDRNRMWLTDSIEYPYAAPLDKPGRDTIKILEDTNNDGKYDKVTTFADGLNIPIGVYPWRNGCIAWSIPNIWFLEDTDNDGKCDRRTKLYGPFDHTRDVHGNVNSLRRGWDGWLYANHGFNNQSQVAGGDGHQVTMHSGNTFRVRMDGSRIEHFTHGQVNPFGSSFDNLFNIFTADCHSKPLTQLLRGAFYPSFGRPHDGMGFVPSMMEHLHGSTAICGVAIIETDNFPPEYRGQIFSGNVMTSRLNRNSFVYHGSTIQAKEETDFLSTEDPWFRPVDLQIGPDGALYIADFYNRIIGHYEVPLPHPGRDRTSGRLWRISYQGNHPETKPAKMPTPLAEMSVGKLIEACDHHTLSYRLRALELLLEQGCSSCPEEIAAVLPQASSRQKTSLLWGLERMERLTAEELTAAAKDASREVRVHAMKILSERKLWDDVVSKLATTELNDSEGFVARAAADAIGRHPQPTFVPLLLERLRKIPAEDSHLRHVLRMAIRDHFAVAENIEPMIPRNLSADELEDIAKIVGSLKSKAATTYLTAQIASAPWSVATVVAIAQPVFAQVAGDDVGVLVAKIRQKYSGNLETELLLVDAIQKGLQQGGNKDSALTPLRGWGEKLLDAALDPKADVVQRRKAIELVGRLKIASRREAIIDVAKASDADAATQQVSVQTLVALSPNGQLAPLAAILADGSVHASLRQRISQAAIDRDESRIAELSKDCVRQLPARLQSQIADGLASDPIAAERLLTLIEQGHAPATLLRSTNIVNKLKGHKNVDINSRIERVVAALPPADFVMDKLLTDRRKIQQQAKPDLVRGEELFKKNCAACHQIGGKGAVVGPQLDGIGNRGAERILEDVLDPNRNVDVAFRTTTLSLTSGKVVSVLVRREEGETIVAVDQQGKELQIPKGEIDQQVKSTLSLMPANVAEIIPANELPHLIGYLVQQRANHPK